MSESQARIIRKRNPGMLQSDKEVREQFVVREHELATVLEVLRGNLDANSCQHTLIVAPRGRGKTMLLARVAAELRADAELASCLVPVRFMEESDEVFNAADFWLEVLFYLALAIDKQDPEFARSLRDTRADLTSRWRERELDERARAAVLEAADVLGKRLVLMVENLQALCANVDDDFGWKLRKTLQTEPQIILVATATSRFEGLDDAREPFFELFRIICLAPLDTAQCRRLWEVASGAEASEREIRPLEILTGGSPRFLVIVAEFARHRSLRRLMEELVQLIDDLTDTFRGDLQAFPKTERRIFLAIADLWKPSTTGEIAVRARMDVRTVSTMLGRLVERGAVLRSGTGRKRLYAAAERLYSIYYKLRRERDDAAVVHGLLHFMAGFYTSSEFATIFEKLLLDAAESSTVLAGAERVRAQIPLVDRMLLAKPWLTGALVADDTGYRAGTSDVQGLRDAIRVLFDKAAKQERIGEDAAAVSTYDDIVNSCEACPATENQVAVARALVNRGLAQERLGERTPAIATYDHVVKRFAASDVVELQVQVAAALINQGVAQDRDGQHVAAIATCEAVDARYRLSSNPELQAQVACALVNKTVALEQLGKHTVVIATCDELVARFGTNAAIPIQEQVARALVNKGFAQEQLGIHSVAISTFNQVIEHYGTCDVPELRVQVATALNRKGATRAQAGEYEAAIATCDEIIERNGASDVLQLQEQVGQALVNKGTMQTQLGDHSAAISTYDQMLRKFGASGDKELHVLTAKCLINKASLHGKLGDHVAEMNIYRTLIDQYAAASSEPELHAVVVKELFNEALALARYGDHEASISTYAKVVDSCDSGDVLELHMQAAKALINKAVEHGELEQLAEAIATLEEVTQRYGGSDETGLIVCVAQALSLNAAAQDRMGDSEAALTTWDRVVARFGTCEEAEVQLHVASALSGKGALLGGLGRHPEAIAAIEDLVERYGNSNDPELREIVAQAMNMKGVGHGLLDDPNATIATSDAVISRFGRSRAPALQVQVAVALFHKGMAQVMTGRVEEAVKTSEELDRRSLGAADDGRHAFKWRARHLRTSSRLAQGNHTSAVDAFCSLYAAFLPENETMVPELVDAVAMLVAAGVPEREIVAILRSEPRKETVVAPLIIALRQRDGETVRAPAEVLEVAADVRQRIDEMEMPLPAVSDDPVSESETQKS